MSFDLREGSAKHSKLLKRGFFFYPDLDVLWQEYFFP